MALNRRSFLYVLGATVGATAINNISGVAQAQSLLSQSETQTFRLTPLPYPYEALEPYIDAETMRFHHDKHYAAYINNLNAAINKYPDLKTKSAEDLLRNLAQIPEDIRTTVRNNGGGYVNHKMFWEIMGPNAGGEPKGKLAQAIQKDFGSFKNFQTAFNDAGSKRFGSGWAWLVQDKSGKLKIVSTANQDSPIMEGIYPIMGNDVWEHAYYLKYKNDRGEYLKQWWNVVNWNEIDKRYMQASRT
jgi:superoxide dismutase, Fe-Mn family